MADFGHIHSRPYRPKRACCRCIWGEDVPHSKGCKHRQERKIAALREELELQDPKLFKTWLMGDHFKYGIAGDYVVVKKDDGTFAVGKVDKANERTGEIK